MLNRYDATRDAAISAAMAASQMRNFPHHCRIGRVRKKLSPPQIIDRMANALIERASVVGGAGEQALRDANFTASEIAAYGERAAERARTLQPA